MKKSFREMNLKELCEAMSVFIYAEVQGISNTFSFNGMREWKVKLRFDGRQLTFSPFHADLIVNELEVDAVLECIIQDVLTFETCKDQFDFMKKMSFIDPDDARDAWNRTKDMVPRIKKFLGCDFDMFANIVKKEM